MAAHADADNEAGHIAHASVANEADRTAHAGVAHALANRADFFCVELRMLWSFAVQTSVVLPLRIA